MVKAMKTDHSPEKRQSLVESPNKNDIAAEVSRIT
jgi:hypothetical protein